MTRNRVPHSPAAHTASNSNLRRFHTYGLRVAIIATLLFAPCRFASAVLLYSGDAYKEGGTSWDVGIDFIGFLQVNGGTTEPNDNGIVGVNAGSVGHATVTGANSAWINSGQLFVGSNGTGQLTVSNGGSVSDTNGVLGLSASGVGSATISGTNSRGTTTTTLPSVTLGKGQLTIAGGGYVENTIGYIGLSRRLERSRHRHGDRLAVEQYRLPLRRPRRGGDGTASGQLDINGGGRVNSLYGYVGNGRSRAAASRSRGPSRCGTIASNFTSATAAQASWRSAVKLRSRTPRATSATPRTRTAVSPFRRVLLTVGQ